MVFAPMSEPLHVCVWGLEAALSLVLSMSVFHMLVSLLPDYGEACQVSSAFLLFLMAVS